MKIDFPNEKQRQRAPSKRSLETRARILDAAEQLFAERGFDGASLRDIAARANSAVGLVHHHGGGKEELLRRTIARRAEELSALRMDALAGIKISKTPTLDDILICFFSPYFERAETDTPQWLSYARLVAHVSADPRWHTITEQYFDPTANIFIDEIAAHFPNVQRQSVAMGFVFSVSAMLALLTSQWRIDALGKNTAPNSAHLDELIAYCAAGIRASVAAAR